MDERRINITEEDNRNDFDEATMSTICALNALLATRIITDDDKAVGRINRFKQWLYKYTDNQNFIHI